jgi:hypothetical protein
MSVTDIQLDCIVICSGLSIANTMLLDEGIFLSRVPLSVFYINSEQYFQVDINTEPVFIFKGSFPSNMPPYDSMIFIPVVLLICLLI